MEAKKLIMPILLFVSCILTFSACTNSSYDDPYKDYVASGLEVKNIPFDYDNLTVFFESDGVELISNYDSYVTYNFCLDYTESYFAQNDLLVFAVWCCSSDEMEFREILKNENKLYPLFYRKEISNDQPITDDSKLMPFCVEISKESEYKVGEIIYRYK